MVKSQFTVSTIGRGETSKALSMTALWRDDLFDKDVDTVNLMSYVFSGEGSCPLRFQ